MERWVSVEELGQAVDKSGRRIRQMDNDLPEKEKLLMKGEGGKYDLFFFIRQWSAYQVKQSGGGKELNLEDVKAQHEKLKMELTQMELDEKRGDLCSTTEIYMLWAEVLRNVTGKLMDIPSTVAPRITNMENAEEIEAAIERELRACLKMLSKTPMPKDVKRDEAGSIVGRHHEDAGATGEDAGE